MKKQNLENRYDDNPLYLNDNAKKNLLSIAQSALLISRFGMVCIALLFIVGLLMLAREFLHDIFLDLKTRYRFLFIGICFMFSLLLSQFGTKAKKAIATQNAALLTESFKKIKWIAQLTGIAATLVVSLYAILIVASWLKLV